jgi:multiple sugar transport system permease protein
VAAILAFALGPLAWELVTAVKPPDEVARLPPVLPSAVSLESYRRVFAPEQGFTRSIANGLAVAALTTGLALVLGGAAAFALAKLPLRGKRPLLLGALAISMFPPIATVSPLYLVIRALGLRDTIPGLVIPYATFALPLAIWNLTTFFRAVPDELYRAARVDGCSPVGALVHVVLPVAAPGVATTAILVFIAAYNELLYALTFTATERARTVPVAIALFSGIYEVPWGEIAAAATVATVPVLAVVLAFQRRVVAGLTAGGVKG